MSLTLCRWASFRRRLSGAGLSRFPLGASPLARGLTGVAPLDLPCRFGEFLLAACLGLWDVAPLGRAGAEVAVRSLPGTCVWGLGAGSAWVALGGSIWVVGGGVNGWSESDGVV